MSEVETQLVEGFGGTRMAVHRLGAGRPVLLLHGLFSSAKVNWIKYGTAAQIAGAGFEAIMPDWRVHGGSEAPGDAAAYPEDVLVKDAFALVDALELADYDLVGFSLGARTAVRAVIEGLSPGKLVLGGMGLEGLSGWAKRAAFFIDVIDRYDTIKRGDPAYFAYSFMKSQKIDREAARLLLTSVDDTEPEALSRVSMPALVVCGADDQDNGSAPALADALPDGRYAEIPGTHMSSVTRKELGREIVAFLKE